MTVFRSRKGWVCLQENRYIGYESRGVVGRMHNLHEQFRGPFVLARRDRNQSLKPTHAGIPDRGVVENICSGLLLGVAWVAVGVRVSSTTDL